MTLRMGQARDRALRLGMRQAPAALVGAQPCCGEKRRLRRGGSASRAGLEKAAAGLHAVQGAGARLTCRLHPTEVIRRSGVAALVGVPLGRRGAE